LGNDQDAMSPHDKTKTVRRIASRISALSYYTARPTPPVRLPRQRVPPANAASGPKTRKASPYESGALPLIVIIRTATTIITIPAITVPAPGRIHVAKYPPIT